jgi:hypothetical protein
MISPQIFVPIKIGLYVSAFVPVFLRSKALLEMGGSKYFVVPPSRVCVCGALCLCGTKTR